MLKRVFRGPGYWRQLLLVLIAASAVVLGGQRGAMALITGGAGNEPVPDPGWQKGGDVVFNNTSRVAYWEGPPFGGGEWHGECRGDAAALNAVLENFAKIDAKVKRVLVRNGPGRSFWLDPNRKGEHGGDANIDWVVVLWQPETWEQLSKMPADINPTAPTDRETGPPAQIEIFTGGNVRWEDVKTPVGLDVNDQRLEAHGFAPTDGVVLEGTVVDLATKQPVAARVEIERIEPQEKGGYHYSVTTRVTADAAGHWVVRHAPEGWHRIVLRAEGFAPRVVGYTQHEGQPSWREFKEGLSPAAPVSGVVTDEAGKPLAEVNVLLRNVVSEHEGSYEAPDEYTVKTDESGQFEFASLPVGSASVCVYKHGYCGPGLGEKINTPKSGVKMTMRPAAQVDVVVDFTGTKRPEGYIVEIEPEGGSKVGSWGGSSNIDKEGRVKFSDVPPGKYEVWGHPNPSTADEHTKRITLDLKGGKTEKVTIKAGGTGQRAGRPRIR